MNETKITKAITISHSPNFNVEKKFLLYCRNLYTNFYLLYVCMYGNQSLFA